ncbi:MAG: hypothetical protein WBA53_11150 [Burkholderiaceae bacterium]
MYRPPEASFDAFVRDVTSTPAEFDASLRQAAAGGLEGGFPSYRVAAGEVRLQIDVVPGAERRIALMRLPTLIVTYRFTAGSRAAQEALLARLDRAMHRGGG